MNLQGASFPFTPGRVFEWSMRRLNPKALLDRFSLELVVYYGAVLLFFLGFTSFFAPLPIYLEGIGFDTGTIFWLYLTSSLGAAAYFLRAATLSERYNDGSLQATGLLLRGLSIPSVAVVGTIAGASTIGLVFATGLFLLIGVTWAIIAVTAATIVTRLAPAAIRGEALGTYAAVSAMAGGLGSLLGGALAEVSFLLAFGISGTFVLLGAALVYRLRDTLEDEPPTNVSNAPG
jgi:MFS family permease